MILVNVLPPELRRSESGINPVVLTVIGGVVVNAALLLLYLYVTQVRIPHHQAILSDLQQQQTAAEAEAKKVDAVQAKITAFKAKRETIVGLLKKKIYQARMLDEFVRMVNGKWAKEGMQISIANLKLSPKAEVKATGGRSRKKTSKKAAPQFLQQEWDMRVRIVGKDPELVGDYIKGFFQTVSGSSYWRGNFEGNPEDRYTGDQRQEAKDIERVYIDMPLKWTRVITPATFIGDEEIKKSDENSNAPKNSAKKEGAS